MPALGRASQSEYDIDKVVLPEDGYIDGASTDSDEAEPSEMPPSDADVSDIVRYWERGEGLEHGGPASTGPNVGKPAARIGDPTAHGGAILTGCPSVLIGNLPASRKGDPHVCPAYSGDKAHVGGFVNGASSSVWIGNAKAARTEDRCDCNNFGISGVAVRPFMGADPTLKETGPNKPTDFDANRDGKADGKEQDGFGTRETTRAWYGNWELEEVTTTTPAHARNWNLPGHVAAQLEAALYRYKRTLTYREGGNEVKRILTVELLPVKIDTRAGWNVGYRGKAEFETGGVKVREETLKRGGYLKNREWEVVRARETVFGHAEFHVDALLGDDGHNRGIKGLAKAGASAVKTRLQAGGERSLREFADVFPPLMVARDVFGLEAPEDWTLKGLFELEADILGIGGGGGGWAYLDGLDDRIHVGSDSQIMLFAGIGLNWDVSFGPRTPKPPPNDMDPGGIPNIIAKGHSKTLIGN